MAAQQYHLGGKYMGRIVELSLLPGTGWKMRFFPVITVLLLALHRAYGVRYQPVGRFALPDPTPQSPKAWAAAAAAAAAEAPCDRQNTAGHQHKPVHGDIQLHDAGLEHSKHRLQQPSHVDHMGAKPVAPALPPHAHSPGLSTDPAAERRRLLQQQESMSGSTNTTSSNSTSSASEVGTAAIPICPAWAPDAANPSGTLPNPNSTNSSSIMFTADFNADPNSGLTTADRTAALSAAAAAALREAAGNNSSNASEAVGSIAFAPGLFDPLSFDEIMAVYVFLFDQRQLNLTPIEVAANNDNYVGWLELAPPNKTEALAWLDQQDQLAAGQALPRDQLLPMPPRVALAMVIQGRHDPPRVVQLAVSPLPAPSSWRYVPLGSDGVTQVGWLQRPYTLPEASLVAPLLGAVTPPLAPLLRHALDGWWFDLNGTCNTTCLTFSLGAPFGAGAAAAAGTMVQPEQPGNWSSGNSSVAGKRHLWAFFYRNMEGHHLHTVGLEIQVDVSAYDPADWKTGQVWFLGSMWPSVDALVATWNSTMANSSSSANATGVDPAARERLKSLNLPAPNATDALFSTFIPRAAPPSAATSPPNASTNTSGGGGGGGGGPPLQYQPGGRRFKLSPSGLDGWMGWSLSLGHRPTSGISFWDMRFRGERVVYELSLQEAFAGYGGPSPMQSHTQYMDSHWGMGSAYKELVAGVDCPLNAAYMDLTYTFNSGPITQRNAICVFELSLGLPLLRHWADAGGGPQYYGALPGSALVLRAISAVYNYDYVQDLKLHLDGSIEVAVHTTGYPQSSWYNREQQGSAYGYPYWYNNSGTIHDHVLNWKVDADVGGTANSIRMDQVVLQQQGQNEGFNEGGTWYSKQLVQQFPATEAEATLFANGSSKANPTATAPPTLFYIINTNSTNRWGSARGYRVQHTLVVTEVLPDSDILGNSKGFAWSKYKVAVTARREWEQSSSSALNQPLPYAPAVDFDTLLQQSKQPATWLGNGTADGVPATATDGQTSAERSGNGDNIQQQDLVLWVTSGLQHLPGSEDAPVTPTSGPAIGFWLRPFNFFDESAAASQPDMVYIPGLTQQQAQAAAAAAAAGDESFTLLNTTAVDLELSSNGSSNATTAAGAGNGPSTLPQAGAAPGVVSVADLPALTAARRGLQPYVGVPLSQQCLPQLPNVPLNGTYTTYASSPNLAAAPTAGANATNSTAAGSGNLTAANGSSNGTGSVGQDAQIG